MNAMTSRWARLLGATLLLLGCGDQDIDHGGADDEDFPTRMAEGYCAATFACDPAQACDAEWQMPYATESECIAAEVEALTEVRDAAHAAGLTYDPACVESTLAQYIELGCSSREELDRRFIRFEGCAPYYGTVPVDENPCFEVVGSALTTCDANLTCNENMTCRPPEASCTCDAGSGCVENMYNDVYCMPMLAAGDVCEDEATNPIGACPPDAPCVSGWDGDVYLGQRCMPLLADGESCTHALECASTGCDGTCRAGHLWLCDSYVMPSRWR